MKRFLAFVAVGIVCGACAASPPPPPPEPVLDPVGVYDYSTMVQGMEMRGTVTITEEDGVLAGTVTSDMGTIILSNFAIDGMELTCVGDMPDASVLFLLVFEGDDFTGEWDADGMSGTITGTKR